MLSPGQKTAMNVYLIALADDQFLLGHRNSEWCGHAPLLEEDIAFANLALDEIGHAAWLYSLAATLKGEDPETYPDRLIYHRPARQFRNLPLVELPPGDWAFSMLRHYLFDAAEAHFLPELANCGYAPLAELAAKTRLEEIYHLRHTQAWVLRLGLGTQESTARMQTALDSLWPYALQFLEPVPGEDELVAARVLPDGRAWREQYVAQVETLFRECNLEIPGERELEYNRQAHTPYFDSLIADLQSVARLDPQATW